MNSLENIKRRLNINVEVFVGKVFQFPEVVTALFLNPRPPKGGCCNP